MGCDFTESVSLLVDGELQPHEAARLRAHIECCAACEQARDAFLLLRRELRSYDLSHDPRAQSKALAAILDSSTRGAEVARRAEAWGLWERLKEAFGVRRLRPAHVAALSLLLIGAALGLRWFTGSHTPSRTLQSEAPLTANANSLPTHEEAASKDGEKKSKDSDAVDGPTVRQAEMQTRAHLAGTNPSFRVRQEIARLRRDSYRTKRQRREGLSVEAPRENVEAPRETARASTPASQPSSPNAVAPYAAGNMRAAADDPASRVGRHAERVERLLRSFRNARLTAADPTLDVADARRLSKRLLYSNIALRREAAGAGDISVKGWLDTLEPILLDISNLPDRPSTDAVGSIKERIRRRQLVGVLQAQAMLTSRP
jgi:hypothetical protein